MKSLEEQRLLVCDNFGSYNFFKFLDFARQYNIRVVSLRLHTSHFMQPLDVVIFQVQKHQHKEAVNQYVSLSYIQFNVSNFIAILSSIYKKTFTYTIVQHGFQKTSLQLINAQKTIAFMRLKYSVGAKGIEAMKKEAITRDIVSKKAMQLLNQVNIHM